MAAVHKFDDIELLEIKMLEFKIKYASRRVEYHRAQLDKWRAELDKVVTERFAT